jgi:hypothetical protein
MDRDYTHGGGAGDIVYHLAPVRDLGGGRFWLNGRRAPLMHGGLRQMESLVPLLRAQPYITAAGVVDGVRGSTWTGGGPGT